MVAAPAGLRPRLSITRAFEWDSAHRIVGHESKCASLHGHRYVAEITCEAPQLDAVDRVIDFSVIREQVGGWLDENWDHTTLVNRADAPLLAFLHEEVARGKHPPYVFDAEPTVETIARELLLVAHGLLLPLGVHVAKVRVYETPTAYADVLWENTPR